MAFSNNSFNVKTLSVESYVGARFHPENFIFFVGTAVFLVDEG